MQFALGKTNVSSKLVVSLIFQIYTLDGFPSQFANLKNLNYYIALPKYLLTTGVF